MSPRVVLHIGSTKTGSSALQATLFERRDTLAEVGALYSPLGVTAGAHHLLAASIHPSAWRIHAADLPEDRDAHFTALSRQIMDDAASAGHHTIVLSSEYFWGSFPAPLYKRLREGFPGARFEVVAYVRRPEEWVVSTYLQALKYGEKRDFSEWFNHWKGRWASGIHYFRVINRWNHFLSADKVHLVRYGDAKGNVYKAFCDALEIAPDTSAPSRVVNPSPTFESVPPMLAVNRSDAPDDEKSRQRRQIMRNQTPTRRTLELLDAETRAEIVKLTHASVRLLERTFVHDGAPLFPAPDPSSPPQAAPASAPA